MTAEEQAAEIIDQVLNRRKIARRDLMGRYRGAPLVAARREVIRALRERVVINGKPASLPWIGRLLNRHYTTVLHYLQTPEPRR